MRLPGATLCATLKARLWNPCGIFGIDTILLLHLCFCTCAPPPHAPVHVRRQRRRRSSHSWLPSRSKMKMLYCLMRFVAKSRSSWSHSAKSARYTALGGGGGKNRKVSPCPCLPRDLTTASYPQPMASAYRNAFEYITANHRKAQGLQVRTGTTDRVALQRCRVGSGFPSFIRPEAASTLVWEGFPPLPTKTTMICRCYIPSRLEVFPPSSSQYPLLCCQVHLIDQAVMRMLPSLVAKALRQAHVTDEAQVCVPMVQDSEGTLTMYIFHANLV